MKLSRSAPVVAFAALLPACAANVVAASSVYKPSEVVARADALVGREVHVRGYLILGDEAHGLWDSSADYEYVRDELPDIEDSAWGRCITVYYNEEAARAIGRNHPRNIMAVGEVGRLLENVLDRGACSRVSLTITNILLRAQPSRR